MSLLQNRKHHLLPVNCHGTVTKHFSSLPIRPQRTGNRKSPLNLHPLPLHRPTSQDIERTTYQSPRASSKQVKIGTKIE